MNTLHRVPSGTSSVGRARLLLATLVVSAAQSVGAQHISQAQVGIAMPPSATANNVDSLVPSQLSGGCQATRAVVTAGAGYLGYLIGALASFPVSLSGGNDKSAPFFEAVGTVAAIVYFADEPLERPLPFCPESMKSLANRTTDGISACRASRIVHAGIGAGLGTLTAFALGIPLVLIGHRNAANAVLIVAPATSALSAAVEAGNRPPCTH